jgi:hypothetical protein
MDSDRTSRIICRSDVREPFSAGLLFSMGEPMPATAALGGTVAGTSSCMLALMSAAAMHGMHDSRMCG